MNQPRDKGLNGNEKIEQAVAALQQEPTQEQLAHTLTVIRRRIKEHGQLVAAVEPNLGSEQMQLRAIRTADGASWWYACFTVYGNEHFEPGDWAPYVQSTVVFGRCHLIDDAAATEARVRELGMKYYPGKEEVEKEIALDIKAVQLYEITIEHLTGKQIQEK